MINSCRQYTETGGIVATRIIAWCTCTGRTIPTLSTGQCFGNFGIAVLTYIITLAAYEVGEDSPFGIAGDVPSVGADALHSAGSGIAGGGIVHYGRPVVEQSVGLFVVDIIVRVVPECCGA